MTYTEILEEYKPNGRRINEDNWAFTTHLLQNGKKENHYLNAIERFKEKEITDTVNETPLFQYKLPIEWDVPFPPPKRPKFSFIDLFSGIGGFRIPLQKIGGKCVFSSEIDKQAKVTYETNFGEFPFGDIRAFTGANVTDKELDNLIPNHDLIAGGFPCQPFSLAGVSARNSLGLSHGFEDTNKGNLFLDIIRIAKIKRPRVLFLENVKNFKSHDKGRTFEYVKSIIENDLGYSFNWKIIDSSPLVPQSRKRFYMVCLRDKSKFDFPELEGEPKQLKSILEDSVPEKFTISDKLWEGHQRRTQRNLLRGTGFTAFVADLDKPSKTLVSRYYKDGKECLIPQEGKNPRKLTPRECARLQGFPSDFIIPVSDAAAYRQFGNSVAVPVISSIVKNINAQINWKKEPLKSIV